MKSIIYINLLFIVLIACVKPKEQEIQKAFDFVLDSILYPKYGMNFEIAPEFSSELNNSLIQIDLGTLDSLHSYNFNFNKVYSQYSLLKGKEIKGYINERYDSLIYLDLSDKSSVYFEFGPPLFNANKTIFAQYFIIYFNKAEKFKWTHQYFICKKNNDKWELVGWIDIGRDKLVRND